MNVLQQVMQCFFIYWSLKQKDLSVTLTRFLILPCFGMLVFVKTCFKVSNHNNGANYLRLPSYHSATWAKMSMLCWFWHVSIRKQGEFLQQSELMHLVCRSTWQRPVAASQRHHWALASVDPVAASPLLLPWTSVDGLQTGNYTRSFGKIFYCFMNLSQNDICCKSNQSPRYKYLFGWLIQVCHWEASWWKDNLCHWS